MGAKISTEHSKEDLEALKTAEEAVWKHYSLENKLKELKISLAAADPQASFSLPAEVRLLQLGPDNGEPVLFVHGGGGSPDDFAALLPSLLDVSSSNKYRVLLLERPGSGLSDPYDFSSTAVDDFYSQFIVSVLDALKITTKVHLVGNSMGGCICVWLARAFPEKMKSLSLVGAPVGFTGMKIPFLIRMLSSWIGKQMMAQPPPRSLPVDLFKTFFHSDMEKVPDETIDFLWTTQKTRNNSLSWQSLLRRIMPSFFGFGSPSPFEWKLEWLEEFPKTFPCLFLVGSEDIDLMTLEQQETVGGYFGGNKLVIGQGHLPWIEEPERVAKALVDFWKQAS